MSLALSWGYAGILNLGHAMSFGLGSYAMAMALKLKTVPVQTGPEGLPDFMVWNNVARLPWFWEPFELDRLRYRAGIVVPALVAGGAWLVHVPRPRHRRLRRHHHARLDGRAQSRDYRPAAPTRRLQRHHRPRPARIFGITFDAYGRSTYYLVAVCLTLRCSSPSPSPRASRPDHPGDPRSREPGAAFRLRRRAPTRFSPSLFRPPSPASRACSTRL